MGSIIDVKDVSKRFGKKDAVISVSFNVKDGECVGLVGVNGAGKTTLISIMMGLLSVSSGGVRLFGESPFSSSVRKRVGYMPELFVPPFYLTVIEFIRLICAMKREDPNSVGDILKLVGLEGVSGKLIGKLSKGMRQRLGIAVAVVGNPDLVILDEPFSGLDPIGRKDMRELISEMRSDGRTMLFSSHILQDVEMIVDRIIILHRGSLVYDGNVYELMKRYNVENLEDAFVRVVGDETTWKKSGSLQ